MGFEFDYDKKHISGVFLGSVLILIFLLLIYLIMPVLEAFALTVVLVYILHPTVEAFMPYIRNRTLAIILTFFFILVPFFILSVVLTSEIIKQIIDISAVPEIKNILDSAGKNFKDILVRPPTGMTDFSTITAYSEVFTQNFGTFIAFIQALGSFFFQVFFAIFLTVYVLFKEDSLNAFRKTVQNEKINRFIDFIDIAMKQIVYSMFLTAFVTGIIATIVYFIFGLPFVILLGALTAVVALIPILGVSLIYVPITIYMISQGDTIRGLTFFLISIGFISVLPDLIVRPLIVGRKENINLGVLVLGFVTGTLAFGAVGVLLGPIIIISVIGFYRIFLIEDDNSNSSKPS